MLFSKDHIKSLIILLVIVTGFVIVVPFANFQDYLAQGDHGRDLYAAQAVFRGELPYRDFWWVYGPLMPYYYGLFFKIFGTKISSMILGKLILRVAAGVLLCLAMMEVSSEIAAFLCACWFMLFHQDFFFTYNHIGGIVMILGVAYCLLSYIQKNSVNKLWGALGFITILCLIKVNFGLAALAVSVITVGVCDHVRRVPFDTSKKLFYMAALIGVPLLTFFVYWSLLKGLSTMEIRECLPYKEGDQPYSTSPWTAIATFLNVTWHSMISNKFNLSFGIIIDLSALRCLFLILKNKLTVERKISFLLSLGMLVIFYIANSHEYLKSGVWYRDFWAQPISIMITFLLIDTAIQSIPQIARKIIFSYIAILAIICWFMVLRSVNSYKTIGQFIPLPRAGIYVTNTPSWIGTVLKTTDYLNNTLKPNELFFALPYDCLYYYLTGKRTPTRQLIFFEHIKIPAEQERSVIADLERNRVNTILVSNRAFARQEFGLGILGSTYCPLIGKYIQDNFIPVIRFGDWLNEPGWAWNHGTFILKRKKPFN